jgi:hypothetical protein
MQMLQGSLIDKSNYGRKQNRTEVPWNWQMYICPHQDVCPLPRLGHLPLGLVMHMVARKAAKQKNHYINS